MSLLVQKVDSMKPVNKGMGEQVSGKIVKFDGRLGLEGHQVNTYLSVNHIPISLT